MKIYHIERQKSINLFLIFSINLKADFQRSLTQIPEAVTIYEANRVPNKQPLVQHGLNQNLPFSSHENKEILPDFEDALKFSITFPPEHSHKY